MLNNFLFSLSMLISGAFSISIMCLLVSHTFFLLKSLSSVEMRLLSRNPFSRSTLLQNWEQVFGPDIKLWFVPVTVETGYDGVYWPIHL